MTDVRADPAVGNKLSDYGTVDEHGETHKTKDNVHQRLRANSSIMKLNKLLGMCCSFDALSAV